MIEYDRSKNAVNITNTSEKTQNWEQTPQTPRDGYWQKYRVIDNRTGEEVHERTFTIKLDSDPHAAAAMRAYANAVWGDNPTLADELWNMFPDTNPVTGEQTMAKQ